MYLGRLMQPVGISVWLSDYTIFDLSSAWGEQENIFILSISLFLFFFHFNLLISHKFYIPLLRWNGVTD